MFEELRSRANQIWTQISSISHPSVRRDLERMFHGAETLLTHLNREMVECRRLGRSTPRSCELEQAVIQRLNDIEQYITLGLLGIDS
jgi:hypothetical protein